MESQWNDRKCTFLRQDLWEIDNLEQVQELRLPDGMPDVGRVLCAWGQSMIRSKEWRGDTVRISGGVTAWVLYAPEDGSEPRCVEIWLPFQAKHNLPQTQRDGVLRGQCYLRSVDARTLSSRKMMVRASVSLSIEALEHTEQPVYQPTALPEGIQLLDKNYPVLLPVEAGERQISVDAEVSCTGGMPVKLVYAMAYPAITDTEIVGSRGIIRGNCLFRLLYLTDEGKLEGKSVSQPFAQYAELEKEYEKNGELSVLPAIASLETQVHEQKIQIQCSLIAQYVLQERQVLSVVEDAYSPCQSVKPVVTQLQLPMVLDQTGWELMADYEKPEDAASVVDITFFADQPTIYRDEMGMHSLCCGNFQLLYADQQGNLRCEMQQWNGEWQLPAAEDSEAKVYLASVEPSAELGNASLHFQASFVSGKGLPVVCGLNVGEKITREEKQPSLLLQRMGTGSLWELAKATGSTVAAIEKANHLTQDAPEGKMLLIPIQ